MGIGGITLSTSLVTLFNACVLGYLMKKKIKMDYKSLFINLLKMCVAGVVAFVGCMLTAFAFDKYIALPKYIFEISKIATVCVVCLAVYVPLNLVLKMDYAGELFERVKSKLARSGK